MRDAHAEIVADYRNTGLSVKQIARKHNVCVRTVYNAIHGNCNRKGYARHGRRYLSINKSEAEFILKALKANADHDYDGSLIERLESIISDLHYQQECEQMGF